jgi:hypothetical protein
MKNWVWRWPPELLFPPPEEELFLDMLKMVCMLERRRIKAGPEEPTDERRG